MEQDAVNTGDVELCCCRRRSEKIQSLVFYSVTSRCITHYILLILPKPTTDTFRQG